MTWGIACTPAPKEEKAGKGQKQHSEDSPSLQDFLAQYPLCTMASPWSAISLGGQAHHAYTSRLLLALQLLLVSYSICINMSTVAKPVLYSIHFSCQVLNWIKITLCCRTEQNTGNASVRQPSCQFCPSGWQGFTERSQPVTASSWPVCTSPPFACSLFPNFYIVPDATLHLPSQCHEAGKVVKCKLRKPVTTKLKSPWH